MARNGAKGSIPTPSPGQATLGARDGCQKQQQSPPGAPCIVSAFTTKLQNKSLVSLRKTRGGSQLQARGDAAAVDKRQAPALQAGRCCMQVSHRVCRAVAYSVSSRRGITQTQLAGPATAASGRVRCEAGRHKGQLWAEGTTGRAAGVQRHAASVSRTDRRFVQCDVQARETSVAWWAASDSESSQPAGRSHRGSLLLFKGGALNQRRIGLQHHRGRGGTEGRRERENATLLATPHRPPAARLTPATHSNRYQHAPRVSACSQPRPSRDACRTLRIARRISASRQAEEWGRNSARREQRAERL